MLVLLSELRIKTLGPRGEQQKKISAMVKRKGEKKRFTEIINFDPISSHVPSNETIVTQMGTMIQFANGRADRSLEHSIF